MLVEPKTGEPVHYFFDREDHASNYKIKTDYQIDVELTEEDFKLPECSHRIGKPIDLRKAEQAPVHVFGDEL